RDPQRARRQQSAGAFHQTARSGRRGGLALRRRQRRRHRAGDFGVRRRNMVTPAPAPAAADKSSGATIEPKARLRLWIRLLRASRFIEGVTRERFKAQFNMTLPRFDVMAALYRKPEGMLMSEIARFLIVSNGNVTGIVDRLVAEGFVARS